tara:strand:+ start:507 stop:1796 length:1290 start_codon:yes stop_codon:yes gene_type:complete
MSSIRYVVIDWGYTRFKLWSLDNNKKVIKSRVYNTNDISKSQIYYEKNDMENIFNIIKNFSLNKDSENELINIYFSVQMHGLSGKLLNGELFFSTWNDEPLIKLRYKFSQTYKGLPILNSMPVNKLIIKDNKYYLSSKYLKYSVEKELEEIEYIYTPIELIFNSFLKTNLIPSKMIMDSLCLPKTYINDIRKIKNNNSQITKSNSKSESTIEIGSNKLIIHPSIGDLQGSTFNDLETSDIILNLGTGSQVIFSEKFNNIQFHHRYYRYYPKYGSLNVISHIPCGRLLKCYCDFIKKDFNYIKNIFNDISPIEFKRTIARNTIDLLFFPGFDIKTFRYRNSGTTTISNIAMNKEKVVLISWLNQYLSIINKFSNNLYHKDNKLNIKVIGELGGITPLIIKLMKQLIPLNTAISVSHSPLEQSIIKCIENI